MYCEIPIFKRCCFCLPLRYGLIAYGYIKLIMMIIVTAMFTTSIAHLVSQAPILAIVLLVMVGDVAASGMFIIGGHFKKTLLLKIYMYYNLVMLAVYVTLEITLTAVHAQHMDPGQWQTLIVKTALDVVIQVYVVFLIRSEVYKLENPIDDTVQYTAGYNRVLTVKTENA